MFGRKKTGSVLCTSCGVLVGVNDETCYNCGRRHPALWGYAPWLRALAAGTGFMPFIFGLCFLMYGLTLVASGAINGSGLDFLGADTRALIIFGASGGVPVFGYKRWWTVLSAGWLHGGLLHIAFNMLALRQLGPSTADLYGSARMVIIYTAGAIAGFTLSAVASVYLPRIPLIGGGVPNITVGASASLAGLIGAHVHYGRRSGSRLIHDQSWQWAISMLVFGFIFSVVDNYAHIGGFAGGYAVSRFLDPLKREQIDHTVIAILCLAASVIAIMYSAIPLLIALNR